MGSRLKCSLLVKCYFQTQRLVLTSRLVQILELAQNIAGLVTSNAHSNQTPSYFSTVRVDIPHVPFTNRRPPTPLLIVEQQYIDIQVT